MNRRQNAEQMLGVHANASPEEISNAFQARVSELTQKQLPAGEFQNELNKLYAAHDLLTKPRHDVSFFDSPFGWSFGYFDNYMRQMRNHMLKEMDDMFEHHRNVFSTHQQLTNQAQEPLQINQSQVQDASNQATQSPQHPQTYRYARSFSKSIKVDQNGNVVGSSNKTIQHNDKVFREEKHFDSATNKMHIKRYKPDGSVKEFEKPYYNKSVKKYIDQ